MYSVLSGEVMEQRRLALDLKSQLERLKLDTEYMRSRYDVLGRCEWRCGCNIAMRSRYVLLATSLLRLSFRFPYLPVHACMMLSPTFGQMCM